MHEPEYKRRGDYQRDTAKHNPKGKTDPYEIRDHLEYRNRQGKTTPEYQYTNESYGTYPCCRIFKILHTGGERQYERKRKVKVDGEPGIESDNKILGEHLCDACP